MLKDGLIVVPCYHYLLNEFVISDNNVLNIPKTINTRSYEILFD